MPLPKLPLQVLEAFEHVARTGSMRRASQEMGLSISSVSHHVARLEQQLGATLIDRASRPFTLTREGRETLHHLSTGLHHLRRATDATAIGGLLGTRSLRIGIVEDFEGNVAPELAVTLAGRMPKASLSIRNVLSHEAPDLLIKGRLDLAVASEMPELRTDIAAQMLLRDPFVLAQPRHIQTEPLDLMQGRSDLPFLRFNKTHLIGKQIDAHLSRNRISLPDRYAFDSVQSIMAVIANGDGWTVLTPTGVVRAQNYAARVRLHPLPLPAFSRRISLLSRADFDPSISHAVASLIRQSLRHVVDDPVCAPYPWLARMFALSGDGSAEWAQTSLQTVPDIPEQSD